MDTLCVPQLLLETLAAKLERPRELTAQVANHLTGNYGIARDDIGPFLADELPKLEDYEIDLILSPLFTPALHDQALFAELLGMDSVPAAQWPALIQKLVVRPTCAQLTTEDGQTHSVPLRDVTLERYVHRLRLEATIPEPLFKLLNHLPPAADRPLLKAVARRAVWENGARREILVRYLTSALVGSSAFTRQDEHVSHQPPEGGTPNDSDSYRLDDVVELLKLAEIYQPADVAELLAHIPHWQQVLRQEISVAGSPKPFFNERVQEMHGGGRDQRRQDDSRITAKENERDFLDRLQKVLAK